VWQLADVSVNFLPPKPPALSAWVFYTGNFSVEIP
jgi:hypothetical protein